VGQGQFYANSILGLGQGGSSLLLVPIMASRSQKRATRTPSSPFSSHSGALAMTAFLPPSTNSYYNGSRYSAWFLVISGLSQALSGMIHSFLPDGGAGVIGGLDLTHGAERVFAMFAWAGATQLAHGIVAVAVGLRYRTLVPLLLVVGLLERILISWSGWIKHIPTNGHHPPEHYVSVISIPVILLFLWLAMRTKATTPDDVSKH
jgi:hypothetical protein